MKFKCPKCGTLIEGQPERCPSCGVKFKWKKPEEAKPNLEKPVSPAPAARPRSDIALMMVVKPAMAKYRELYPEDVIDDEEVKKIIVENVERDTDEVLSEIHKIVLLREREKAEAEEEALRAAEEVKQKELKDKKRPYYKLGMEAALATFVFAPSAFVLGSALLTMQVNNTDCPMANFLFLGVILASIVLFVLSIVRFARCVGSMRTGDFDRFVERIKNKKKPKLPVHLVFAIVDFSLLTALMITVFVTLNSYLGTLPFGWFITQILCFLVFACVPFVLGFVFYGQQRKKIQ